MSHFATMLDTLQNFVTGLGQLGTDPSLNTQYIFQELDRITLENMYRGDWLARKICDAPADDMTREWRAWQASQPQIEALEELEKALDLQRKIKQWISLARLYGGGALIMGVNDGNDPSQPIDLNKCKKDCLEYVVVLSCWDLSAGERIYDVRNPYFSRPSYYTIATPMFGFGGVTVPTVIAQPKQQGAVRTFLNNVVPLTRRNNTINATSFNLGLSQIHPSRVLELPGNELPDWRLAARGGGWGDSVLQTVVDTMRAFTTTIQSIAAMVSDGKLDVVKIPDMALNLNTPGYKNKLIDRFTLSTQTKSVISALLLDKEEDWQRVNTQYAGLPMIMHEFITFISGAANIPVSRLFGQAMGRGLSGGSTSGGGESDLRNYYDECASQQKNSIAPRIAILDQVLMRSALGKEDPNIHYDWNPLWQLSDEEKSKIAFAKAQTTQIYATLGIVNTDALREGVVNQLIEDGTYPGLDDAIEEHGSEPEEGDATGGFQPGAAAGYQPGAEKPPPLPPEKQSFGQQQDEWDPDKHPRGQPGNAGQFVSGGGGIEELGAGGIGGAGTFGKTEPAGGRVASPGVPDKLVQAIENHVAGMGGEFGKHGSADLSEWIMRTQKAAILKLIDNTTEPFLLLHKGDAAKGMPTVWLLAWNNEHSTSIHDHLESEVGVSVARGTVGNRIYETGPGYFEKAKSQEGLPIKTGESMLKSGQTVQLKSPYIHEMFGTAEKGAKRDVTVHAYEPPLSQMHYFERSADGKSLHYVGDWDESRVPETLGIGGGTLQTRVKLTKDRVMNCPCCMMRRYK
jgi:hypothetical protein